MAWGVLTTIDLYKCDPELIRDEKVLRQYLIDLVKLIDMVAYGEPFVKHFGSCPEVMGYTISQPIHTSLISGHFIEITNATCIEIFSCKDYSAYDVAEFTKSYFKSAFVEYRIIDRLTNAALL